MCVCIIDCINYRRSSRDVTHWFVEKHFEAFNLHFGRRHLAFLEPEVTIFRREGGAEQMLSYQLMLVLAS